MKLAVRLLNESNYLIKLKQDVLGLQGDLLVDRLIQLIADRHFERSTFRTIHRLRKRYRATCNAISRNSPILVIGVTEGEANTLLVFLLGRHLDLSRLID
jgi:hypothetical protein